MNFETRCVIAVDHPSLPGHFPGTPVVPGVVILDEIAGALAHWRPSARIVGLPVVKFMLPLRPNQPFTIRLTASENKATLIHFRCGEQARVIAEGRLEIECESSRLT